MKQKIFSFIIICCMLDGFSVATATPITIDVTATNPPYVSEQLLAYLEYQNPEAIAGLVTADGTAYTSPWDTNDIWGHSTNSKVVGDGVDEWIPFSFIFPKFRTIYEVTLTLDLKRINDPETDQLFFADNWTQWNPVNQGYGNKIITSKPQNVREYIVLDLMNIDRQDNNIMYDLSSLLLDGNLGVAYADDALIYSATLSITGDPVPEPSSFILLGFGLIGLAGIRRKLSRK